jgi:NAD-dependent SIR2 family protein deacetylase
MSKCHQGTTPQTENTTMLDLLKAKLDREAKRAIFTHGRVEDWYCAACSKALDIDRLPPEMIIIKADGKSIGYKVLCMPCIDERGGKSGMTKRLVNTVSPAMPNATITVEYV